MAIQMIFESAELLQVFSVNILKCETNVLGTKFLEQLCWLNHGQYSVYGK